MVTYIFLLVADVRCISISFLFNSANTVVRWCSWLLTHSLCNASLDVWLPYIWWLGVISIVNKLVVNCWEVFMPYKIINHRRQDYPVIPFSHLFKIRWSQLVRNLFKKLRWHADRYGVGCLSKRVSHSTTSRRVHAWRRCLHSWTVHH